MGVGRGLSVLACAALAACGFDAEYAAGYKCVEDGDCPDGQSCVDNTCQLAGEPIADAANVGPDADVQLPPNLLEDPDFEQGIEPNWESYESTLSEIGDDPHRGQTAVRVCATASGTFTLNQRFSDGPVAGETYVASVWVRQATEPVEVRVVIREATDGDWIDHAGADTEVGADWQKLTHQATVEDVDRDEGRFLVWGLTDDSCFEVDDAYLYLTGS